MRRTLAFLAVTLLLRAPPIGAQGNARVHLSVGLKADSSGRTWHPVIRTEDLLGDPRVGSMLSSVSAGRPRIKVAAAASPNSVRTERSAG